MKEYNKKIKDHYDAVAKKEKDSASSTMADDTIRKLETQYIIDTIESYINEDNNKSKIYSLIDVGCGNGYTLECLNASRNDLQLTGLELNDSLRELAVKRFNTTKVEIKGGDIRDFDSLANLSPDILICQRVLINLLDIDDQIQAFHNLVKTVSSGGLIIFIESFEKGLSLLNEARGEFGIKALEPAHHNKYLPEKFFNHPNLSVYDDSHEYILSKHYFVTRVLHEFFILKTGNKFERNSHFVNFFTNSLGISGQYNPLRLITFKKI